MRQDLTAILMIVDRSGSMASLRQATVDNINKFLNEQKEVAGDVMLSLCFFSDTYSLFYDFTDLKSVKELHAIDYEPYGCTALLDALGNSIDYFGADLAHMREEDRPSKVVVMVITDGMENFSRHLTLEQVKEKVQHQTEKYSWQFCFVGANMDAISVGDSMGFSQQNSINYVASVDGTAQAYTTMSNSISSFRSNAGHGGRLTIAEHAVNAPTTASVLTFDPDNFIFTPSTK